LVSVTWKSSSRKDDKALQDRAALFKKKAADEDAKTAQKTAAEKLKLEDDLERKQDANALAAMTREANHRTGAPSREAGWRHCLQQGIRRSRAEQDPERQAGIGGD
jgi:hypothetical protein